jgi:hypothetical protein
MTTEAQQRFDTMSKKFHLGRRFDGRTPELRNLLAQAKRYVRASWQFSTNRGNPPPPRVYMVSNPLLNAWAYGEAGYDFIAFSTGTSHVVNSTFGRMMRCPQVFPDYGEARNEPGCQRTASLTRNEKELPNGAHTPSDPNRLQLAKIFTRHFFDLLIAHELDHLRSGQFGLAHSQGTGTCLAEMGASPVISRTDRIKAQTLEMNADSYAVWQGLVNLFSALQNLETDHSQESATVIRHQAFEAWLFAALTMYALFQEEPLDLARLDATSHPPGCVRLIWTIRHARQMAIIGSIPLSEQDVFALAGRTIENLKVAVAAVSNDTGLGMSLDLATEPAVDKHLDELNGRWKLLYPQLKQFAYGSELPVPLP